jgi:penicillin-binding protein 2
MRNAEFGSPTRKRIFYGIILFIAFVLIGRLYQLQLIYRDEFGKQSQENSVRTILREPIRGMLFDRRGRLIVDNRPSYTVTITPYEFRNENIPALAALMNLEEEMLRQRIHRARGWSLFLPSKIHRDADFELIVALEEMRDRFPGVGYVVEAKRHYNSSARLSHVLGYTKEISERQLAQQPDIYRPGDIIGSSGIEAAFERVLRGEFGFEYVMVNARGQFVADYGEGKRNVPAREGSDLFLTIDAELQAYAEELLGTRSGSIVAIDPQNGEILVMISKPDYDLSLFSGVTPPELWSALNADSTRPLFNRATSSIYPPGSTYKMVLAAAALENNIITEHTTVNCPGFYRFGNRIYRCHKPEGHGRVNVVDAIKVSCNVFFYHTMLETGFDAWTDFGRRFSFGRRTGIEGLDETPGILPDENYYNRVYGARGWTRGNLVSLAIGQGEMSVTPLQMAVYAMMLANKGIHYRPKLVSHIYDVSTRQIIEMPVRSERREISNRTWDLIRRGMHKVVDEDGGTARAARIPGISSAGKTGTSQNPHGEGHAWYIGFAPYDNPRIAIAVVIENIGYGGAHAAPVAGRIIAKYLSGDAIAQQIPQTVPSTEAVRDVVRDTE